MTCTLGEICRDYQTIRPLSDGAAYLMRRTVALYGEHLERLATVDDLSDLAVSGWLRAIETRYSAWTLAGHRVRILSLWRFAAHRGHCDPPGEVRRAPPPTPMPDAWTVDEVRRLVAATDELPPDAGPYFRALVLTAYECGLRRSDLRALRRDQIDQDGTIVLRQHKTGRPHVAAIRPETAAMVLALPGSCPLACPWGPKKYSQLWARLRSLAGLRAGACQQLRRTGASWIAAADGIDAASRWLGHLSPEMIRHYVDRRIAAPQRRLPPRLG